MFVCCRGRQIAHLSLLKTPWNAVFTLFTGISDNLQSCHFPVYHSINSYIFLSKFSNFLVITSLENRLSKNLIIRLFLILFSIILSYYASFAILFISSFASINPRCVYTFNVTPISECPIKYWSAFGFIPAFAIL